MAILHCYQVIWEMLYGGKPIQNGTTMITAADNNPSTIKTALATAGVSYPGGTVNLVHVKNMVVNTTN